MMGGRSKAPKAELATAQAAIKAAKLNFMVMTPVKSW
jgi:hypothetical protein